MLNCVNAQIDCYQVIPTVESMAREVSKSVAVSKAERGRPKADRAIVSFQKNISK